jgi:hypothetical protein
VKIESPGFTEVNVRAFLQETLEHERTRLADRLEAASTRLAAVVAEGVSKGGTKDAGWSGQETLAHIVVLSKFYGVLTSQVGAGKLTEVDLLDAAQGRDLAAEPLLDVPSATLLAMAQREHKRTTAYLRNSSATDLGRRARVLQDQTLSAYEMASLALCAHLEVHIKQLEQAR